MRLLFYSLILIIGLAGCTDRQSASHYLLLNQVSFMELTSSAFIHNGAMDARYTCDGEDINPPLMISEVPAGAKVLVLIMEDPDAVKPTGKVWDHWLVFDIPPDTKEIAEGHEPRGVHGIGTSGNLDYHGPCPPDGEHHYIFKLYALDAELNLSEGVNKHEIEEAMEGHILGQTTLVGTYSRK